MILLDENIAEDQCHLLRKWRFRFGQIGQGVGRQGMKDEDQILPLLHKLDRPTFFTRDIGFFDRERCHQGYCLVNLDAGQKDSAGLVRRVLRHPALNTKAKRMGTVMRVRTTGLTVWRWDTDEAERLPWKRKR